MSLMACGGEGRTSCTLDSPWSFVSEHTEEAYEEVDMMEFGSERDIHAAITVCLLLGAVFSTSQPTPVTS